MVKLSELVAYSNDLLEIDRFNDFAPNGLQVEGRHDVRQIAAAVTASLDVVEAAADAGADLLLVHHGYFWKGEAAAISGMKKRRLEKLLRHNISLLAYHLPLDVHAELGNNRQLGMRLGIDSATALPACGGLPLVGRLAQPLSAAGLAALLQEKLDHKPLYIGGRSAPIRTIAWCTGAAQRYCEQAAMAGIDAYISGEVSEQTTHVCRELAIDYFAAGHHATERYGVQALARHLAERFSLQWEFVDCNNPV